MSKQFLALFFALALSLGFVANPAIAPSQAPIQPWEGYAMEFIKPNEEQLRQALSPLQYHVTQEAGTEPPFNNAYWQEDRPGIYVDIVTGEPLFSSKDKYQSSCGWPAFTDSLTDEQVVEIEDKSFGMLRTEVRSRLGDTHLGHVFQNDPESPNGTRYCINSASLRFVPQEEMEAAGYGAWLSLLD